MDERGFLSNNPATMMSSATATATMRALPSAGSPERIHRSPPENETPSWRLTNRMRTVGIGLVMALNVGTDPPDIVKPHPCAKLQCWIDPSKLHRNKAKETIGERLEAQYARYQQTRAARPLKYRRALDPTVEDVRALCVWLRKQAKQERILLHYNGHGVPRPTSNGEVWVFDKNHTEYIPLAVSDLRQWMDKPSIVVLDCSSAGILIPFFTAPSESTNSVENTPPTTPPLVGMDPFDETANSQQNRDAGEDGISTQWEDNVIVLCPTSDQEWLPMHPDYPADIFTACLTTPIQMALRWFVLRNPISMSGLHLDAMNAIPGKPNDRKSPLGELNWIFTTITDSIAWQVLPRPMFQRLFRQDLLVAGMFRSFLLADRILRSLNCTPQSHPPLPPGVAQHPLWHAWDLACETCLFGLIQQGVLGNHVATSVNKDALRNPANVSGSSTTSTPTAMTPSPNEKMDTLQRNEGTNKSPMQMPTVSPTAATMASLNVSSLFFSEQLTAFETWLRFAPIHKSRLEAHQRDPINNPELGLPEQLPVVLQVLLSQGHRVRALVLLRRFLDLGPWAVNLSLSLGIFPYVMKLLQSPEYKSLLVSIWASILKFDSTCQIDLVKDGALQHFVHLMKPWGGPPPSNISDPSMARWARPKQHGDLTDGAKQQTLAAFTVAAACYRYASAQSECIRQNLHGFYYSLLNKYEKLAQSASGGFSEEAEKALPPLLRLWICICVGNMVQRNRLVQSELFGASLQLALHARLSDLNPLVRAGACYALGCLLEKGPKTTTDTDFDASQGTQIVSPPTSPGSFSSGQSILLPQSVMPIPGPPVASGFMTGQMHPGGNGNAVWNVPNQSQQGRLIQSQHIRQQQPNQLNHQQMQQMGERQRQSNMMQSGMRMVPPNHQINSAVTSTGQQQQMFRRQIHSVTPQLMQRTNTSGGPNTLLNVMPMSHDHPVSSSLVGHPNRESPQRPLLLSPLLSAPLEPRRRSSVFDDSRNMEFDLGTLKVLVKALTECSSVVRYEAVMAISCAIEKYLLAYLAVAEEMSSVASTPNDASGDDDESETAQTKSLEGVGQVISVPPGVSRTMLDQFAESWKALRVVQRGDAFPRVAQAANAIVSRVHEQLLDARMTRSRLQDDKRSDRTKSGSINSMDGTELLAGITEEGPGQDGDLTPMNSQNSSGASYLYGQPHSDGPPHRTTPGPEYPLRRIVSEHGPALEWQQNQGKSLSNLNLRSVKLHASKNATFNTLSQAATASYNVHTKVEYTLPKSEFYDEQKEQFRCNYDDKTDEEIQLNDPLSLICATLTYQERRNENIRAIGNKLANRFVALAPKLPKTRHGVDILLDDDDDEDEADDTNSHLKNELKLQEKKLLDNFGVKMTSMIRLHSYEDVLMVCDDRDGVSIWNHEDGNQYCSFKNGSAKSSRMTTSFWIDESSKSLCCIGCDDGSVRLWSNAISSNGRQLSDPPVLSSAFSAAPDTTSGQRGTGLVCEWLESSRTLLAGGNSRYVRCWDLESETCANTISTDTDASVTTLETAWNSDAGSNFDSYSGIGPHIVVAGHSDGSLKIFDIRAPHVVAESKTRRSRRPMSYNEHASWIVGTTFTDYGGRPEVITGSISGDIRAWDLRMSSSLRVLDVQRSPMTALSVHKQVPVAATGSHAQFIKILTLEGETLQVVRFYEHMSNQRIGPVSCLEFHSRKFILAAGFANSVVSIYKPRDPIRF